jgi:hypothetical protein
MQRPGLFATYFTLPSPEIAILLVLFPDWKYYRRADDDFDITTSSVIILLMMSASSAVSYSHIARIIAITASLLTFTTYRTIIPQPCHTRQAEHFIFQMSPGSSFHATFIPAQYWPLKKLYCWCRRGPPTIRCLTVNAHRDISCWLSNATTEARLKAMTTHYHHIIIGAFAWWLNSRRI